MVTSTSLKELHEERVEIPNGVNVNLNNNIIEIKGPLGKVSKDFSKIIAEVSINNNIVSIKSFSNRKKHISTTTTSKSLIKNMIIGVTKGFTYKLKIVFAHFPITVKVKGNQVHIENFYGERSPRIAQIIGNSKIEVKEDDIIVKGISIYDVGQTAANIEQATKVKNKDLRVFLDGVYVYDKRREK